MWQPLVGLILLVNAGSGGAAWTFEEKQSLLDDSPLVIATKAASEGDGSLLLRCQERELVVAVVATRMIHMDSRKPMSLQLRVGAEKPESASWMASSNGHAAGLWNTRAALPILQRLEAAKSLFVRMHGYSTNYDLYFNLDGIVDAGRRVREACKL